MALDKEKLNEGYVCLYRVMLRWPWFKKPKTLQLFIYCLLKSTRQPYDSSVGDVPVRIERGQMLFTQRNASEDTGLSRIEVRTALQHLLSAKSIILASQIANRPSILTVVNYDSYQSPKDVVSQPNSQPVANGQPTDSQPIAHLQDVKNRRTEEQKKKETPLSPPEGTVVTDVTQDVTAVTGITRYSSGDDGDILPTQVVATRKKPDGPPYTQAFLAWWKEYPQQGRERSGRKPAWEMWVKVGAEKHYEEIMASLPAWNLSQKWTKEDGQFIEGAHRWLKARAWEDPPPPATPPKPVLTNHQKAVQEARDRLKNLPVEPTENPNHEQRRIQTSPRPSNQPVLLADIGGPERRLAPIPIEDKYKSQVSFLSRPDDVRGREPVAADSDVQEGAGYRPEDIPF